MPLQGNIETFYLSSLLQLLCNDKKTGILKIFEGNDIVSVYIKDGYIIHASSSIKTEQLGYLLRSEGVINTEALHICLKLTRAENQKLGKVLVDHGYITSDILIKFVHLQAENILYDLFMWVKGNFQYEDCSIDIEGDVGTEINIMELILEASRRVDEMSVFAKLVPESTHILKIPDIAHDVSRLNAQEYVIFALIDGIRTIKQIIYESGYDEFTVYKILYSLISSGFVQSFKQSSETAPSIGTGLEINMTTPSNETDIFRFAPDHESLTLVDMQIIPPAADITADQDSALSTGEDNTVSLIVDQSPEPADKSESVEPLKDIAEKSIIIESLPKIRTPDTIKSPDLLIKQKETSDLKLFGILFSRTTAVCSTILFILAALCCMFFFFPPAFLLKHGATQEPIKKIQGADQLPASLQNNDSAVIHQNEDNRSVETLKNNVQDTQTIAKAETDSYQDSNASFFLNLPTGYQILDRSTDSKTQVFFNFASTIYITIVSIPYKSSWNPEDSMYSAIAEIQAGKGKYVGLTIQSYSLIECGGGKGYTLEISGYTGPLFCKAQRYLLVGYQKMISIEILCKNCRRTDSDVLFQQVKESIIKSLIIYP